MVDLHEDDREQLPPAKGRRFTWFGLALATVGGVILGLLWAWGTAAAQDIFAPLILFPLLVGAGVGISVVGLVRAGQIGHRPSILASVLLAASIAAVGQHYFIYLRYLDACRQAATVGGQPNLAAVVQYITPSFDEYVQTQARIGRTLLFDYTAHGWMVWFTWAVDVLLTVAAAVAAVVPAMFLPYCARCRTWYRVTRCGKMDLPTAERLAEAVGVELPEKHRSPRYRLSNCQGGCGPTRCEISWEGADGDVSLYRVWLDAAQRRQAAEILDPFKEDDEAVSASDESLNRE